MFFVLSKILSFIIQPINWIVLLLAWALLTRIEHRRRRLLRWTLIGVLFFTNPLALHVASRLWEPYDLVPVVEITESYDVAIVLGGFSAADRELRDRLYLNESGTRLTHALELYKQGKVEKILVTGGAGNVVGEKIGEAEQVLAFLERMDLPMEDMLLEGESRNTHENAVKTAELLKEILPEAERVLLVTSSSHMRRAMACFRKQGIDPDPFPVLVTRPFPDAWPQTIIMPNSRGFEDWGRLMKEWVGYAVYKATGKL